jgi:pyridoxine 4-dehydrogenase
VTNPTPLGVDIGRYRVRRVGFGAMQLPGPGVLGPPRDPSSARAVLRRAVELGVDHVDTAQFYGPDVANELIREVLHPYPEHLVIVSKVGARRDSKGRWLPAQRPEELRSGVEDNLRSLDLDSVPVVNLRVHDDTGALPPAQRVTLDDQLAEMTAMRDEGLIGAIGLSNVTLPQLDQAVAGTEIVCVQNAYNLADRSSAPVLARCEELGVTFVAFFPLGSAFSADNPVLGLPGVAAVAGRLGATPAQVALAALLAESPVMALIPGTSSVPHLEDNLAAASIHLDEEARAALGIPGGGDRTNP